MVSVDRNYSRVMLFDSTGHSRQRITKQLSSPPRHPELINPYITSMEDDRLNGPYYFRVESISASNARGLPELENFKLPGVIVLSLHKQNLSAFISVSTQLLEAQIHKRCPVVCLVGISDLQFHEKLQRAIATAERNGLTCAIAWNSEEPQQDEDAGLMSMCARLKRVVHRSMCADLALKDATQLDRRDNSREQNGEGNQGKASSGKASSSNGSSTSQTPGKHQGANNLAKMFATPTTSPIKASRKEVAPGMFDFQRAGKLRKEAARNKIAKSNTAKRWHRKHSLHGDDLKKYLGKNQLSENMKLRLRGKVELTKAKLKDRPVVAIFRDVLQPDFIQTPLPLQRSSKADSLTRRGHERLYEKKLYRQSIIDFTIALQEVEHHFYARFYRSLGYATVGRFRPALLDMKKCLELVQKHQVERGAGCDDNTRLAYICYFNLALLHLNVHEHEWAIRRLKEAERLDSFAPGVGFLRGFLRRRRGNYDKSRVDYVLASKLKLRQDIGPAAAALIEHAYHSKIEHQTQEIYQHVIRSPKKKSQILSFLTSIQKAFITSGPDRNEMHMQYIAALMTNQMWYKKLSEESQIKLCRGIEYSTLEKGEWVFRRDENSTGFYIIMSGTLHIMVMDVGMSTETQAGSLGSHDTFGELGLLNNTTRSASICAASATELLTIPKLLFNNCGICEALKLVRQDKHDAIVMSNVLNGLPNKFLKDATDFATIRIYEQGKTLVRQGQHSESVFVMLQGVCDVWQKIDIREVLVHRRKVLLDETENLKKKYVYHHQIIYNSAAVEGKVNVHDDTLIEKKMQHFEEELLILNKQIKELDDKKLAKYRKMSKWKRIQAANKAKIQGGQKIKKVRLAEIMAPSFFGEASMRGDGSLEHADVVASTRVVVLRIFMSQMDFSKVNDSFIERLSNLTAVKTLSLSNLSKRAQGESGWTNYRKTLLNFINKSRWPVRNGHVSEGPMGTSVIHELPGPRGSL